VAELELTVVLPCLNEAETLVTVIEKAQKSLASLGIAGEVVVADNGSTDGSQDLARAAGARVVDVPVRGYGAALQAGIAAAQGRFIIMGDADDSYALEDLGPFVEALRGGADLVMGNRFAGGIAPGAMPWLHRYLGNPVLSFLGRLFFRIPVHDFHCGMRGFSREAIRSLDLQTTGMEFASEMVVRAALSNLRIVEVPTILRPDGRSRAPHLRTWRDGWRHLKFLLAFSPRWLFLYPSLVLLGLGTLGMVLLYVQPVRIGSLTFDVQTMVVAATAVVVGVQGLQHLLGLFGRNIPAHAADGVHAVVDAVAGQHLQDVHDDLPVFPRIHEKGHKTDLMPCHAQPEQMAVDPLQLTDEGAQVQGSLGNLHTGNRFHRLHIAG
jgi:hypothetical protein